MRRTGQRGVVVGVAAVALLAGCVGTESGQPGHTFEVIDEDGVPTAVNSAVPKYDGELFTYEKILEIRPDQGNEESFLYQPAALTMDGDGYYVADTMNHRIAVFDRNGRYARQIGRRGSGPGELQTPGGPPAWFSVQDGILSVYVSSRAVTARFRTDGDLVEEISTAELSPSGTAVDRTATGEIVVWELVSEPDPDYMLTASRVRLFGPNGSVVAVITTPTVRMAAFVQVPWSERPAAVGLNYAAWPEAHYLPSNQVLVSSGVDPVLRWYDLTGALVREVRFELAVEVTADDRAAIETAFDRKIAAVVETGDVRRAESLRSERRALRFSEYKSPWVMTVAERSGHVWLFKPLAGWGTQAFDREQGHSARIVSPAGEYLGDTTLPSGASVGVGMRIIDGHLLVIIEDADSGESVPTVYRIRPASPEFVYP